MNSPFANIYLALIARLSTITVGATDGAQQLFIDLDYGQLETRERPTIAMPCCLIDFQEWSFENNGALVQPGSGIIMLKLATDPYSETSSITPGTYTQAGLSILDLEYQVFRLLQGWSPVINTDNATPPNPTQATQPLIRVHLTSDNRRPGIKVRPMAFTCSFTDFSAKRPYNLISPPNPTITTSFT